MPAEVPTTEEFAALEARVAKLEAFTPDVEPPLQPLGVVNSGFEYPTLPPGEFRYAEKLNETISNSPESSAMRRALRSVRSNRQHGGGVIVPNPSPGNGIVQSGFETPDLAEPTFEYTPSGTAWTFSSGSGIATNGSAFTTGNPDTSDGSQVAFLQTTAFITQVVRLDGQPACVKFICAQRGNFQATYQVLEVQIGDTVVGTIQPSGTSYQQFVSAAFTLPAGLHTLTIRGLNPNGGDNTALIDFVDITPPVNPTVPITPPVVPPPPPPPPPINPPPPAIGIMSMQRANCVGGWVLEGNESGLGIRGFGMRGPFDVDWRTGELRIASHPYEARVNRYILPAYGLGGNEADYPRVAPIGAVQTPWHLKELSGGEISTWASRPNGVFVGQDGRWSYTRRTFYQPTSQPIARYWDDGTVYQIPGGRQEGEGCGFAKRPPVAGVIQEPHFGVIGAESNKGVTGLACYNYATGDTILFSGSIHGAASFNRDSRCFVPPDTWPEHWTPQNPENGSEDPSYAYCFKPRLIAGDPQSPTETSLLAACLADPNDLDARQDYADHVEGRLTAPDLAMLLRWGVWSQVWPAHQANGDILFDSTHGIVGSVFCGQYDQNYQYQNEGFAPPGASYRVSYALAAITRKVTHRWVDGVIDWRYPEFEDVSYFGRPGGMAWGPTRETFLAVDTECGPYNTVIRLFASGLSA